MSKKQINNNVLIAEFMGYEEIVFPVTARYLGQYTHPISKRVYKEDELDFDRDWNLLISVLKKIRGIVNEEMNFAEFDDHRGLEQRLNPYTYDIESIYNGVVEFIKSYNYANRN